MSRASRHPAQFDRPLGQQHLLRLRIHVVEATGHCPGVVTEEQDVEASRDVVSVDETVVPVGGPGRRWHRRLSVVVADFNRICGVGEVDDADAARVP